MVESSSNIDVPSDEVLTKFIDEYFKHMLEDPRVRNRYLSHDITALKGSYKAYVLSLFQNNSTGYTGRSLSQAHSGLGITKEEFEVALNYIQDAASDAGFTYSEKQVIVAKLTSIKEEVMGN